MANISNADGYISLGGEGWDNKDIEKANQLFEYIDGTGQGISVDEKFSTDSHKVKFRSFGIHSFTENLISFDGWVKYQKSFRPGMEWYEDFVRSMSKRELFFEFEFTDYEYGWELIYEKSGVLEPHEGVLGWLETGHEDLSYKYKSFDENRGKICNLILEHTDLKVDYDGLYNDLSPTLIWELEKVFLMKGDE